MKKFSFASLMIFLAYVSCFGQTSFQGLTPGKSTRADVERVLGQPINKVSETLIEYRARPFTSKVFVQYRKDSPVIERIEVLKDGASALYGSEAVGGVINIITKKNYNGAEISGRVGFPTESTSNDLLEYRASGTIAGDCSRAFHFVIGRNSETVSMNWCDSLCMRSRSLCPVSATTGAWSR